MTPTDTDPPDDVPAEIATALEACSDGQLRHVIQYAQRLLQDLPQLTDAIEPRPGEDIVRIEEHDDYTIAIVKRTEESDQSHGQHAYRVKWEPEFDDGGGKYRWHYLGSVDTDSGGE